MDGARCINAAEARPSGKGNRRLKWTPRCSAFPKPLGAPVGSMLIGPRKLIDEGRGCASASWRDAPGGILAAAGLIALEESPKGLSADHANARAIEKRLQAIDALQFLPLKPTSSSSMSAPAAGTHARSARP